MQARSAAVMATRWSRLHGEFYLRRGQGFGEVEDVEELMVVLWLRGIGQRRSVEGVWLMVAIASRSPRSWKRMAGVKWRDERRVSEALAFIWSTDARRGDAGRACTPRGGQLLNRSATASF